MAADRVFFLMVNHPVRGWVRVGNSYSTRESAASWRGFVRKAWHGCPVQVEMLKLHYTESGELSPETIRVLDQRFNLDAPAAKSPETPARAEGGSD